MRVLGVDFSGARDAGKAIWIAEGEASDDGVRIASCFPARDLNGGNPEKDVALAALVAHIAGQGAAWVGFDFPFSLPAALIDEPDWDAFLANFHRRYPTAEALREFCVDRANGKELKRRTDVAARAPFSAYNLRLFRQTYSGIGHVLHPLVSTGRARVLGLQPLTDGKPVLVETCPASLLKAEGLYFSYKGRGEAPLAARRKILSSLVRRRALRPLPRTLRNRVLKNTGGDALDAVIAAICAARASRLPEAELCNHPIEKLEARIFF